ncbi:hypothetical protein CRG98_039835, partial [Punica granatum]
VAGVGEGQVAEAGEVPLELGHACHVGAHPGIKEPGKVLPRGVVGNVFVMIAGRGVRLNHTCCGASENSGGKTGSAQEKQNDDEDRGAEEKQRTHDAAGKIMKSKSKKRMD